MSAIRPLAYLRRAAHEQPIIFYSIVLGSLGPLAVLFVPPIRKKYFGYRKPEEIPTSYPLPRRARTSVSGYDD